MMPAGDHRYDGPNHRTAPSGVDHDAVLAKAVKRSDWMRQGFYVVVLLVALGGQVSGAVEALGIPVLVAIPAVGALELGGVVVMTNADVRRRLGERATGSRILSAAIALGAVAFNWLAHADHLLGGFFSGMSLLGYFVYLMHTENKRRDRLRAKGDIAQTTPAYELAGHWMRHPLLTRRARSLAKANPKLDLYGSLAAARDEIIEERRLRAIAKIVRRRMRRTAQSKDHAALAVAAYPLDQIATRVAGRADLDTLADDIATEMAPRAVAGPRPGWAALNPWKWSARLAATLAAQAAEHQRATTEAEARTAELISAREQNLAEQIEQISARADEANRRADDAEQTIERLRAEHSEQNRHLIETFEQDVKNLRARHEQELAEQTAQAARRAAEQARAEAARAAEQEREQAEQKAREQAAEQRRAEAAERTEPTRHQRKPAEVATLHSDTQIADNLWNTYREQVAQLGKPMSRYAVQQAGSCASRQADRVLLILASRWAEQTAQAPARAGEQNSAQVAEQAARADRADDPEEQAS